MSMCEPLVVGLLVVLGAWGVMYTIAAELLDRLFWDHRRKLERTTNGK